MGRIVRHQLEKAQAEKGNQHLLRLAGMIRGPQDLSSRNGFTPHTVITVDKGDFRIFGRNKRK